LVFFAVLLVRPQILELSTKAISLRGGLLAIATGYVVANITLIVVGKSFAEEASGLGFRYIFVWLVAPFFEELVFRGTILASLLQRSPKVIAIVLSAVLVGTLHESVWNAILGELLFGVLYVSNRRSLGVSLLAHVTANTVFTFRAIMVPPFWIHH